MKRFTPLLTVLLLMLAAVFGWFLPFWVTAVSDTGMENAVETMRIESVSLTYESDLDPVGKLSALAAGLLPYAMPLQTGVLAREGEMIAVAEEFLQEATETELGYYGAYAIPHMRMGDGESIVVWKVVTELGEPGKAELLIDDATGVILSFVLYSEVTGSGYHALWPSAALPEPAGDAAAQIVAAYRTHLLRRVEQPVSIEEETVRSDNIDRYLNITITGENGQRSAVPLYIFWPYGEISFNPIGEEWVESAVEP